MQTVPRVRLRAAYGFENCFGACGERPGIQLISSGIVVGLTRRVPLCRYEPEDELWWRGCLGRRLRPRGGAVALWFCRCGGRGEAAQ